MVKAWREEVIIPTYEVGLPEKTPIFLEKRVYQGSSGAVYPYPVIESISDEKRDKAYNAVFLENEYLKIMILPELGGRIQMAYDKIRQRHFIYYNHVIKPAFVGLAGPWISGGIEFNWPQHHRPSTFMPVDCRIEENEDGSVTVWVNEMERMTHQKGIAGFTLRPGHAYLEINGAVSNRTDLPQTFLWWANPAVSVNDHYQSVFPPDINAVFDHGKRAVSTFPIATGTYYKMDYSAGVDISNYRNIKVPTSYMGVNSKYDFEGGYENDTRAGMLHVASHHFSPGKKQWTWGNGDFGRAWDRNLTDEDGPYIELMAGVFTENQPDFSWLMPGEEKRFTQYFMPYRELGVVKNASKDLLLNVERCGDDEVEVKIFATSEITAEMALLADGKEIFTDEVRLSPEQVYAKKVKLAEKEWEDLRVEIRSNGKLLLDWEQPDDEIFQIPDSAEAALPPQDIKTCEQLYLTGLHLEQYRHATFNPTDYYKEALRRDPLDVRCNNALGLWYLRHGRFEKAEEYFQTAVKVLQKRNPNPYDGEPIYNLGLALKYQGRLDDAYNQFMKATWNAAWQDAGFYEAAKISAIRMRWEDALWETEQSLIRNTHHHQARTLRAAVLMRMGRNDEALALIEESLRIDPFNYGSLLLKNKITEDEASLELMKHLMHRNPHNYDEVALDFANAGFLGEAWMMWDIAEKENAVTPMTYYYLGWAMLSCTKNLPDMTTGAYNEFRRIALEFFSKGKDADPDYCFPNRLEAILALDAAKEADKSDAKARYYLGNLYYDKRQYSLAIKNWEESERLDPEFAMTHRNLALAYFNKLGMRHEALAQIRIAVNLQKEDPRLLMEYDQLRKRLHHDFESRLKNLQENMKLTEQRDDLLVEMATLLNMTGRYNEAITLIDSHIFHPWEGGEGKVPAQYQYARVELAKKALKENNSSEAIRLLEECLEYPHHLGEGKLQGAQDNDFLFLMGCAYCKLGDEERAKECFEKATEGPTEPAAALYYNDAKPDKIFYAGLAYRALGKEDKARGLFHKLLNYGMQHLNDEVKIDYFAVSLPDLLIWEDDLQKRNEVHCRYMMALGYAGLGDSKRYDKYIMQAAQEDLNHQGISSTISLFAAFPELINVKS